MSNNTTPTVALDPICDWDWNPDGTGYTYTSDPVTNTNGYMYRAVLTRDNDALVPDGDFYPTVLGISEYNDVDVSLPGPAETDDLEDELRFFLDHFQRNDAIEMFTRYVRIFHGGDVKMMRSTVHQNGFTYLSVVTLDTWTNVWGEPDSTALDADNPDWQAYIDGEVYILNLERAIVVDDPEDADWEELSDLTLGGIYGDDYAVSLAAEELARVMAYDLDHLEELTSEQEEGKNQVNDLSLTDRYAAYVECAQTRTTGQIDESTFAYTTKGGTYILATPAHWTDDGRPHDLIAIAPTVSGYAVTALRPTVNPDLVETVERELNR